MWNVESSLKFSEDLKSQVDKSIEAFLTRKDLGFLNPRATMNAINDCEKQKDFFMNKDKIFVIGVGGSSLGTKALCGALKPEWQSKIQFLDNVDSMTIDDILNSTEDFSKVAWIICSKSGSTIEVTSLYDYCYEWVNKKHNYSIVNNTACVTEEKSSQIYNFAKANRCVLLDMPKSVGGRFSAFTNIGLYPLSFLNIDLKSVLTTYEKTLKVHDQLSVMVCHLWSTLQNQTSSLYSFQYCDRMFYWGLWLQQLWSESLAKNETKNKSTALPVATFVPCRGASDQHSVLQQLIEGVEKKSACFYLVEDSFKSEVSISNSHFENSLMKGRGLGELLKVEAQATIQAVQESGSPTLVFGAEALNESSMTELMLLWMLTIGVLGELAQIDAFNQPGVESGKIIARRVLGQPD